MDDQASRGVVASGNFKTRRVELPCLLKREVLKSMGIAQLRTIGRSNRRAGTQGKEPGPAVSSIVPSTSQTTIDQALSSQAATNQPPSSPPAQKSAVPDEDCVISHIQPPAPRKRALTDCSGPLLPCGKPVPPLKIKRVKGNEGVVNSRGRVKARDLNMRVWPRKCWSRKCWSGRGSPYLPNSSRIASTNAAISTTATTAATLAISDNVVDLTGNSEDEEDQSTTDSHYCSRTMEFHKAIMRSRASASTAQINGRAIDSMSHELLMQWSLPGGSHCYVGPANCQSPYLHTNSRTVSTTTTTTTTATAPASSSSGKNVVDLTGNSKDKKDWSTTDPHSCSWTTEFQKAITRSCGSGSTMQINGKAIDTLSHELLVRSSLPGGSHCYVGPASYQSPYLDTNSRTVSTTTTTTTATAPTSSSSGRNGIDLTGNGKDKKDQSTTDLLSCSQTMEFQKAIMRSCASSSMAQINGRAIDSLSHKLLVQSSRPGHSYRNIRPAVRQSLPFPVPSTFRNPFTPPMTLPPNYLPALQTMMASFNAMPFEAQIGPGNPAFGLPWPAASVRAPAQFSSLPSQPPRYSLRDHSIPRSLLSASGDIGCHGNVELEAMLEQEEVLGMKTENGSVYLLVKKHPDCAAEWTTVTQFVDYLRWKIQWNLPMSPGNRGIPGVPHNSNTTSPLASSIPSKPSTTTCMKDSISSSNVTNSPPSSLLPSSTAKKKPKENFVVQIPLVSTIPSELSTPSCTKASISGSSMVNSSLSSLPPSSTAKKKPKEDFVTRVPQASAIPSKPSTPNCLKGGINVTNSSLSSIPPSSTAKKPKKKFVMRVSASSHTGNRRGSGSTAGGTGFTNSGRSSVEPYEIVKDTGKGLYALRCTGSDKLVQQSRRGARLQLSNCPLLDDQTDSIASPLTPPTGTPDDVTDSPMLSQDPDTSLVHTPGVYFCYCLPNT